MRQAVRFNINDHVRVQLTEHGREALRQRTDELNAWIRARNPHATLMPYDVVEEDVDGWSRWQLWDLMARLGPSMNMGMTPPIETEIEIETREQ